MARSVKNSGVENWWGSHISLFSIGPLEGSSAGLFAELTRSIHGVILFCMQILQKLPINKRAISLSAFPRTRAEAAASLSMKKIVGPVPLSCVRWCADMQAARISRT